MSIAARASAYAAHKYRRLRADPRFFLMTHTARFEFVREWATQAKDFTPLIHSASTLIGSAHRSNTVLETLQREGYYVGLQLAPAAVTELRALARRTVAYADRDPGLPFYIAERGKLERKLGRKLRNANHFEAQRDWPIFKRIISDPWLIAIAHSYLGCEPLYLRSEILWTFDKPVTWQERIGTAQVLHCDINDYKTLKVFFYLTDVGAESGPHEYIKKRPRLWRHQLLGQRVCGIPDGTLIETYGEPVTIMGPAGTGFIGDPYTFHRGNPPVKGQRLLLQFELGRRRYRTWYYDV